MLGRHGFALIVALLGALLFPVLRLRLDAEVAFAVVVGLVLLQALAQLGVRLLWHRLERDERNDQRRRVDDLIARSRLSELDIRKVDLRSSTLSRELDVDIDVVDDALAGMTAILAGLARVDGETPASVVSWDFPFPAPESKVREAAIASIMFATGLGRRNAQALLDAVALHVRGELTSAKARGERSLEVFPLGLYQALDEALPTFAPQPVLLAKLYPDLGYVLGFLYPQLDRERAPA